MNEHGSSTAIFRISSMAEETYGRLARKSTWRKSSALTLNRKQLKHYERQNTGFKQAIWGTEQASGN